METFSAMGVLAFIFSLGAMARVRKLENRLKKLGILEEKEGAGGDD